jgi:hypothetical protein
MRVIRLQAGRPEDRGSIPGRWRDFSRNDILQSDCEANHKVIRPSGAAGFLFGVKERRIERRLHLLVESWLRMRGAIPHFLMRLYCVLFN